MTVKFHPEFPNDVWRYKEQYATITLGLGERFRDELDHAIQSVKAAPLSAGHLVIVGSKLVPQVRRRNLRKFPFFVLYGVHDQALLFGAVIPSRSDPLTWLTRFA